MSVPDETSVVMSGIGSVDVDCSTVGEDSTVGVVVGFPCVVGRVGIVGRVGVVGRVGLHGVVTGGPVRSGYILCCINTVPNSTNICPISADNPIS